MKLNFLPRRGYVRRPTPIEALPNLSKALGMGVNLWIKRDDLLPGAAGGNKTRKLDFLIADALAQGCDCLITCGGVQSNHCRLTLSWANKENLPCHLLLEEDVPYDPQATGNNLLYHILGVASITVIPTGLDLLAEMEKIAVKLRAQGHKPYIIPEGASNALGCAGYASCALEIQEQSMAMRVPFKAIFTPSGSAGTQGGLALGLASLSAATQVIGVNVSRANDQQVPKVLKLTKKAYELLEVGPFPDSIIENEDRFFHPGYALPNDEMIEAVELLGRTEGIVLDPVYTGKAMAGMLSQVREGRFAKGDNVLFLHTGGSPALYAYADTFLKKN